MQVDVIAGLEVPRHRLGPDASKAHLALRVVGLDEVDVERNLAVHAHRLDFGDLYGTSAFQHGGTDPRIGFSRSYVN